MNASDVNHVSNNYINQQDLSRFMTPKNVSEIKKAYANIGVNRTTSQLRKLAEPQKSGNAKRVMWYWLVRNGFVEIPLQNYCEAAQSNPRDKDNRFFIRTQGMKNIDNINLDNLEPNIADMFGWIDRTTGRNYWLVEQDEYVQITPMIKADIAEVRPVPINKGDNNYGQ